ncbi:MAG: electron transfer flavoprotein subunit alpha/FixB family protein [Flavobacteriales bacterium]|nr:electron transfer flavoprotein subunit alpha/FixB family protein [Flavobacteriales bacterium]
MSVLVYIQTQDGKATKAGLEVASFAKNMNVGNVTALVPGTLSGDGGLGSVGVSKVLHFSEGVTDNAQLSKLTQAAAQSVDASTIEFSGNNDGNSIAPRVAIAMNVGYVSGVTCLPDSKTFTRNVFSGKATAAVNVKSDVCVISITPNSYGIKSDAGEASVETFSADIGAQRVVLNGFTPTSNDGSVPLPEAERVVSAGRGLKGPENWGIVEDLARALGATTACSRPVGDMGWRPHHEHVGQTGLTIRPDLYIACGISGAIQHLAGVNQSKVIVVINTDPEAPFFKAADYGIVGDVFEVLPKLTEAIKEL